MVSRRQAFRSAALWLPNVPIVASRANRPTHNRIRRLTPRSYDYAQCSGHDDR
jgi:hypothetical protein